MPKKTKKVETPRPVNIEFNVGEYETMQDFIQHLSSPKKIILTNFIAGTARGLGFIFGAAAVLTLAGYILSQYLVNIPFVGELFSSLDLWLKNNLSSY